MGMFDWFVKKLGILVLDEYDLHEGINALENDPRALDESMKILNKSSKGRDVLTLLWSVFDGHATLARAWFLVPNAKLGNVTPDRYVREMGESEGFQPLFKALSRTQYMPGRR